MNSSKALDRFRENIVVHPVVIPELSGNRLVDERHRSFRIHRIENVANCFALTLRSADNGNLGVVPVTAARLVKAAVVIAAADICLIDFHNAYELK